MTINNVGLVSHSPLTQNDIVRMPKNATMPQLDAITPDTYDSGKNSGWKKAIIGLVVAAAAIVGLKHLGKNSFMKVDEGATSIMSSIKKGVNKLGDWIETPFIAVYNKIKGLFGKKGLAADAADAAEKAADAAEKVADAVAESAEKAAGAAS